MANDNASLGKASLWSAIIGVVLPGCLAVLVAVFLKAPNEPGPAYGICGLLFLILELVALGCGIGARRTATGKAGLAVSGIMVLVFLVLLPPVLIGVASWSFLAFMVLTIVAVCLLAWVLVGRGRAAGLLSEGDTHERHE